MSIALMTLAWKSGLESGPKFVLVALCDNANDQGECYPSVPMIAQKCSMGERTVQRHITTMEELGILRRELRNGRSTVYHIDPRQFGTPANLAPVPDRHHTPAKLALPPPPNRHPTPANLAPITIKEPSGEPPKNQRTPKAASVVPVTLPDWLPLDAWNGFLAMRREKKKPPTDRAVELILADLAKWRSAGLDVAAILNKSTRNGWLDVFEPRPTAAEGQPGQGGHAQQPAAYRPRKPQGFDPKGIDESAAEYDARIAAAETAQRRAQKP